MRLRALQILSRCDPWARAFKLQQDTIRTFHTTCSDILKGNCRLRQLDDRLLDIRRNLFSTLFIMAAEAAGVPRHRLPLYAFVFQCLRAQVTGCDNLLDDEFKEVIPFDLPGGGIRFRSVLTIMTADAALTARIMRDVSGRHMTPEEGIALASAVLAVLLPSGIEEHEEEDSDNLIPPTVHTMLSDVHHRKTGLLFSAPVLLAQRMGDTNPDRAEQVVLALSRFGVACQILDDLKDVADDLLDGKCNIVVSQAWHGDDPRLQGRVRDFLKESPRDPDQAQDVAASLKPAATVCRRRAVEMFLDARKLLSACLPAFGMKEAAALGMLVQQAILKDRNDILVRGRL